MKANMWANGILAAIRISAAGAICLQDPDGSGFSATVIVAFLVAVVVAVGGGAGGGSGRGGGCIVLPAVSDNGILFVAAVSIVPGNNENWWWVLFPERPVYDVQDICLPESCGL